MRRVVFCLGATLLALGLSAPAGADEPSSRQKSARARPKEAPLEQSDPWCGQKPRFWTRVTRADIGKYCLLVQRADARMFTSPAQAKTLSEQALDVLPSGTAARLSHARALLLLGDVQNAHGSFSAVLARLNSKDRRAFLRAPVSAAAARAALLTADYPRAFELYRAAVLRLSDVPGEREKARVLIEAATAASYAGGSFGPEARAYLAAALSKNAPLLTTIAQAAWALSFRRDGDIERARSLVSQFESSWHLHWIFEGRPTSLGHPSEVLPVLPPGEASALSAVVAEGVEPKAASLHWEEFRDKTGNSLPTHLRLIPQE